MSTRSKKRRVATEVVQSDKRRKIEDTAEWLELIRELEELYRDDSNVNVKNEALAVQQFKGEKFTILTYNFPDCFFQFSTKTGEQLVVYSHSIADDTHAKIISRSAGSYCHWSTVVHQGWHTSIKTVMIKADDWNDELYSMFAVKGLRYPYEEYLDRIRACRSRESIRLLFDAQLITRCFLLPTLLTQLIPLFRSVYISLYSERKYVFTPWSTVLQRISQPLDTIVWLNFGTSSDEEPLQMTELDKTVFMYTIQTVPWFTDLRLLNFPSCFFNRSLDEVYHDRPSFISQLQQTKVTRIDYHMELTYHSNELAHLIPDPELDLLHLPLKTLEIRKNTRRMQLLWQAWMRAGLPESVLARTCQSLRIQQHITSDLLIDMLRHLPRLQSFTASKRLSVSDVNALIAAIKEHGYFHHLYPCPSVLETVMASRIVEVATRDNAFIINSLPIEVDDLCRLVFQYGVWS